MEEKRPSGETWLKKAGLKSKLGEGFMPKPPVVMGVTHSAAPGSSPSGNIALSSNLTVSHLMIMWLQTDNRLKVDREHVEWGKKRSKDYLGRAFLEDCHRHVISWSERSLMALFLLEKGKNRCKESVEKEGRKTATWNLIKPRTLCWLPFQKQEGENWFGLFLSRRQETNTKNG